METHFLSESVKGLERSQAGSGVSRPWFNPHGDCIVYQTANEAVVAERVDDFLTIYRSANDGRPIGFELKEVLALIKALGYDTLRLSAEVKGDELVSVRALYLAAYERVRKSIRVRQGYAQAPLPDFDEDTVSVPLRAAA